MHPETAQVEWVRIFGQEIVSEPSALSVVSHETGTLVYLAGAFEGEDAQFGYVNVSAFSSVGQEDAFVSKVRLLFCTPTILFICVICFYLHPFCGCLLSNLPSDYCFDTETALAVLSVCGICAMGEEAA